MYTIEASNSLFQFSLRKHHDIEFIRRNVCYCFNVLDEAVVVLEVNQEFQQNVNEDALVYLTITYRSDGFLTFVELGIIKYKQLSLPIDVFFLCLNKNFNDDVVTLLNDDYFLLARGMKLYKVDGKIEVRDGEELLFLNEDSIRKA